MHQVHQSPLVGNPQKIAVRIGQLFRLALSSNQAGEALGALGAVKRTLASAGLGLHAVEIGLQSPQRSNQHIDVADWQRAARFCIDRAELLSEKEMRFVRVMLGYKRHPSDRQLAWLADIEGRLQS